MVSALAVWLGAAGIAGALPPGFLDTQVAGGWNQAVGLTFSAEGRMFVWEKAGRVWIVENGQKAPVPLIDIAEEVGNFGDYGLLGFAVDPHYSNNGYIYLLYVVDYHHLKHFGTPQYNPNANQYNHDTIARITRYTCNAADDFKSVDYGSRLILIGESASTGFPICHLSHGIGSLAFGADGTLLASCGDAASYEVVDVGQNINGSSNTCLSDGIIKPKEKVGSYRSQLVDSLNGKIVRIDPATGDGVPGNPFFDPDDPRAPRSRMWAMGLRNPYRFTVRPGTGSPDIADADPGSLYIGDVGWNAWEELNIARTGGVNFGWPVYEGMHVHTAYFNASPQNQDAYNPLFGTTPPGQGLCMQQYFLFRQLIVQETLNPNPSYPNPCNPAQQIPDSVPKFIHRRPSIDWGHSGSGPARTGIFVNGEAAVVNVGAPGSPVSGPQFGGFCAIGGAWYSGDNFPPEYQDSYFVADYVFGWIHRMIFDHHDDPVEIIPFAPMGTGAIVAMAVDPVSGALYYINYNDGSNVRKIEWVDNLPPTLVATVEPTYGPAPLTVQFDTTGTTDDEGGPLTFWFEFQDGGPPAPGLNPSFVYPSVDITMEGVFIAKVFSLNPPHPIGGGNWNPEVMRDGVYPPVGSQNSQQQYDTFHIGQQGDEDFVGHNYGLPDRIFTGLIFQEGKHFFDGGWFDQVTVQVRAGGQWVEAQNVTFQPSYPGNNGISYETFHIRFTPIAGRAIRLIGKPGGSAKFISIGELRVLALPMEPVIGPKLYNPVVTAVDGLGAASSKTLSVSLNNTPPTAVVTSPANGALYSLTGLTNVMLTAEIFDAEHPPEELTCAWQTILHHNDHVHPEPVDPNCTTQTTLFPVGCHEGTYFYEIVLTVADTHGLSTSATVFMYPDCTPIFGDFDLDYDVDLYDFAALGNCFSGSGTGFAGEACAVFDADRDGDVDHADYVVWVEYMNGPQVHE